MAAASEQFRSVFTRVHEVVIFGAGYAGVAAALALRQAGRQVLLVDRDGSLLWESSRAFHSLAGESREPAWAEFLCRLTGKNAARQGRIDGALAEIEMTDALAAGGVNFLYYASPVAVELAGGELAAVTLGTKSGLRRLAAGAWIDATEEGTLARLLDSALAGFRAERQLLAAVIRAPAWPQSEPGLAAAEALPAVRLAWLPGVWGDERCLQVELPGSVDRPRLALPSALRAWRDSAAVPAGAVVSHAGLTALPIYAAAGSAPRLPANVQAALPAVAGTGAALAERFTLGLRAAEAVLAGPSCSAGGEWLTRPVKRELPAATIEAEVSVAGLGTGGALAALAAARAGRKTAGIELALFCGGIGTGGGIPIYYHGVSGGLQAEVDERVRKLDPLFAQPEQMPCLWHSDAKKIALDELLQDAGVQTLYGTLLVEVQVRGRRVVEALLAGPTGPVRLRAAAWIDGTGDGDLAAAAGAGFRFGRPGDGRLHAYTQSSGRVDEKDGKLRLACVNFDSGFVDSTDAEDLTRARVTGVRQYAQAEYDAARRPTYVAPLLGLRQGRQIRTRCEVTLADLIERREYADGVGYTGCHYDNHSCDLEFESDEAVFWVWGCRMWLGATASQIPYGVLVPEDLDNVWLASRALGVSLDAHHSLRMQRDMQRIGEVAGLAAALAVAGSCSNRDVPLPELQNQLKRSGALTLPATGQDAYGGIVGRETFQRFERLASESDQLKADLELIRSDPAAKDQELADRRGYALWRLYRAGRKALAGLLPLLKAGATAPQVSWRAALAAAMAGEPAAESRLVSAIAAREEGFADSPPNRRPDQNNHMAANWITAVALLRRCGTSACLPVLKELAADPQLTLNLRTSVALTVARLAERKVLAGEGLRTAAAILAQLFATPVANARGPVRRGVLSRAAPPAEAPFGRAVEDQTWQLRLAVGRASRALDLELPAECGELRADPRALVRSAYRRLTEQPCACGEPV